MSEAVPAKPGPEDVKIITLAGSGEPDPRDVSAVCEPGPGAVVFHAAPDGSVLAILLPTDGIGTDSRERRERAGRLAATVR